MRGEIGGQGVTLEGKAMRVNEKEKMSTGSKGEYKYLTKKLRQGKSNPNL